MTIEDTHPSHEGARGEHGLMAVLPTPTEESKPFWQACDAGELHMQRCGACAHLFYYARRLCPRCGSSALRWERVSGRGRIYSFSEVHVAFQGPEWNRQLPYTVLLVDLDEGPRMLSRWFAPAGTPAPRVGDRVGVVFPSVDGHRLPFFTTVTDESEATS